MKDKKRVDVGILVYDRSYGMTGVVVEKNPSLSFAPGDQVETGTWDWGILYEDGQIGYADNNELEVISE